jgi:hypothetical protein
MDLKERLSKLLKDRGLDVKIGIAEGCPKFIYDALKEGEHMVILRRDRSKWKVVIDAEDFINEWIPRL